MPVNGILKGHMRVVSILTGDHSAPTLTGGQPLIHRIPFLLGFSVNVEHHPAAGLTEPKSGPEHLPWNYCDVSVKFGIWP